MVAKPTEPYPFPISPHTIWVVGQLIEIPRTNNVYDGDEFYIQSFSKDFLPSIEYDYYTHEILRFLKSEKIIQIHYGDEKGVQEYTLPIKGKPKHRMAAEWLVSVRNRALLYKFYNKLAYRIKSAQANTRDSFTCRFFISDDAVLWLESEKGRYPLRLLYEELVAHKVLATLFEFGIVELDEKDRIKGTGKYAGTIVKSLQDSLRGVGFDKILKDQVLLISTRNKIAINIPTTTLPKYIHDYLVEHFEEVSKVQKNLTSARMQKRKSLRHYSLDQFRERES